MDDNRLGKMAFGDPLLRKQWMKNGMLKAGKTSALNKFKGRTFNSPIFTKNTGIQVGNKGNEIIYDFDGFLAQEPLEGDAMLSGTGENYKKFSASFYTKNFHNTVAVPKEWDLQEIGSMELNRTSKQRADLSDQYKRISDQAHFDVMQGFVEDQTPTHVIMPNGKTSKGALTATDTPSLALLDHIIYCATVGEHFSVGADRGGMRQWADSSDNGGEAMVLDLMVDYHFLFKLDQDPAWRALYGSLLTNNLKNPLLTGVVTNHKNLRITRAPILQGRSSARQLNRTAVEGAGFRRFDADSGKWQGEKGFDNNSGNLLGTAVVIGAGAMISHSTLCPVDPFTIEFSNHKQRKEAALHYYMNVKRTQLFEHNGDYADRKMAGYDLGLINVDYHL